MRARQRRRIALAVIALIVVAAMIGLFTLSDFWRASNPATPTTTVEFVDV
jgi:multisubunit Na+/H+ antiporter MnhG subunit